MITIPGNFDVYVPDSLPRESQITRYKRLQRDLEAFTYNCPNIIRQDTVQRHFDGIECEKYTRSIMPVLSVSRDDIELDLESEITAKEGHPHKGIDKKKVSVFVQEHLPALLKTESEGVDELHDFFESVEDSKERSKNALFEREYEQQRRAVEINLIGEENFVKGKLDNEILPNLKTLFNVRLGYKYDRKTASVDVDIWFPGWESFPIPEKKLGTTSTGGVSIRKKGIKDTNAETLILLLGTMIYIAGHILNASVYIQHVFISAWGPMKRFGYGWADFDRDSFQRRGSWPHAVIIDAFNPFNHLFNIMKSNFSLKEWDVNDLLQAISQEKSQVSKPVPSFDKRKFCVLSVYDAKIIEKSISNNQEIADAIRDADINDQDFVIVDKKYKAMLDEILNRPANTL